MSLIHIIVADPHPENLRRLTSTVEAIPTCRVVATSSAGDTCLQKIVALRPEIAILAIDLPSLTGRQVLSAVVEARLPTRIILTANHPKRVDAQIALNAGAFAQISKELPAQSLHECITAVASGQKWNSRSPTVETRSRRIGMLGSLTAREREVTSLAAIGLTNKAIARRLNVSDGTVRIHLQNIFKKLGVTNRTELAVHVIDFAGTQIL